MTRGMTANGALPSVASVTLTLTDGRTVLWGTTDRTAEKAEIAVFTTALNRWQMATKLYEAGIR